MKITSYAQHYEDVIIYHALQKLVPPPDLSWIDVGANDPIEDSVTNLLYLNGNHGINIEPQANYFLRLSKERPDDINLQLGVSDKPGELTLYGGGTTASFNSINSLKHDKTSYVVKVDTLSSICSKYVEGNIHFLKIDVEGWEKQVLSGMNFEHWRPWILCIEACKPGTEELEYSSWEPLVLDAEYQYVQTVGLNRWYVAKEHRELEILSIPELKKIYSIKKYSSVKNPVKRLIIALYWLDCMKPVRILWRKTKNVFHGQNPSKGL